MLLIAFFCALLSYFLFIFRFAWQGIIWLKTSASRQLYSQSVGAAPATVYLSTVLDLLFFRRTFSTGKFLWTGSWIFHLSFFFVALRHTRFFFSSLPDCLIFLQPAGLVAGYLLPVSLLYLIGRRLLAGKERYASPYNYGLSVMLFLISSIGLAMRMFFRPDVVMVKQFSLGIVSFSPQPLPESLLFLFHFGLFLFLLPYLPTHILAAPFVNLEANRRAEELRYVIHDK